MNQINAIKPIMKSPAYQLVEQYLRKMIMTGELQPGEVLPTELDLAKQLEVTRPTVREAFRTLESSGLLARGSRRRMVVSIPSTEISSNAMQQAIIMNGITVREIWQLGLVLEPLAARLSATNPDKKLLAKMEQNLKRTQDNINDAESLVAADIEFHDLVAQAAGNSALLLARAPIGEFLFPVYGAVIDKLGPGQRLLEAHTKIFEAIKVNDEETAWEWMNKHIRDFMQGCKMARLPFDEPISNVNRNWI